MMSLFKKNTKRVVTVRFKTYANSNLVEESYGFPTSLPTPNIGEYVWIDVHRSGKVVGIDHKLDNNVYNTTIHVTQFI